MINDEIALIGESTKSHLIAWMIMDFDLDILGAKSMSALVREHISNTEFLGVTRALTFQRHMWGAGSEPPKKFLPSVH